MTAESVSHCCCQGTGRAEEMVDGKGRGASANTASVLQPL